MLKDADPFLELVFLTGVSKFSWSVASSSHPDLATDLKPSGHLSVSIFSGLNNLRDISLDKKFGDICGYNQEELEKTFDQEIKNHDKEKIKEWYNGYNFRGTPVYNPYDILNLFTTGEFRNYWFETGTPTFLIKLIEKNNYYVPDLENIHASDNLLSSFDVDNIVLETILYQAGYLTIENEHEFHLSNQSFMLFMLPFPSNGTHLMLLQIMRDTTHPSFTLISQVLAFLLFAKIPPTKVESI